MRSLAVLILIAVLSSFAAQAAPCSTSEALQKTQVRWRVDRYVYDPSLQREWKVLLDCDHPAAPARIELVSATREAKPKQATKVAQGAASEAAKTSTSSPAPIKAGEIVEVSSPAHSLAIISIQGVAMQTAFPGQKIRVRLSVSGHFVNGFVRGSHSVELAGAAAMPSWGKP